MFRHKTGQSAFYMFRHKAGQHSRVHNIKVCFLWNSIFHPHYQRSGQRKCYIGHFFKNIYSQKSQITQQLLSQFISKNIKHGLQFCFDTTVHWAKSFLSSNYNLHPNIGKKVVHTILQTFPIVLTRRICLNNQSIFSL